MFFGKKKSKFPKKFKLLPNVKMYYDIIRNAEIFNFQFFSKHNVLQKKIKNPLEYSGIFWDILLFGGQGNGIFKLFFYLVFLKLING
jgi:hypothetical protein